MKKRIHICLILVIFTILCLPAMVFAATPVSVTVDDKPLNLDTPAKLIDGRTMVSLRAILEALGLELKWDADSKTVTATNGDCTIVLPIGSKTATVNGKAVELDVPAQINSSGRTIVPARFIAESTGANVEWDRNTRSVHIKSENYTRNINNTNNISNVSGSNITINNSNTDNSVNNSNNVANNYNYSTKISNDISNTSTTIGNMDEILKQIDVQNGFKNPGMLDIKYLITDKADNKPIKGAVLFTNGTACGISDENGIIRFGVYGYATNLIKVVKDGYKDYQATKTYKDKMEETIALEAGTDSGTGVCRFADSSLEKTIRDALGKPVGYLTEDDLSRIVGLKASDLGIKNLEGIEKLVNLEDLDISCNDISDLEPLSALKKLKNLKMDYNKFTDLTPLGNLTTLENLNIANNKVQDISALASLGGMKYLDLSGTGITDINALANMNELVQLNLQGTQVIDVSVLSGLKKLKELLLGEPSL